MYSSEEELDEARYRSFNDWLNIVTTSDESQDEHLEKIEGSKAETLKLEIAYDLHKLARINQKDDDPSASNTSHDSLIDKFIQHNPRIIPNEARAPFEDMSGDSEKEHESFFTDTLAKIYIKQGNYAKAIFAYEKLSLKYPEKSAYFAGQISKIKKLIRKS